MSNGDSILNIQSYMLTSSSDVPSAIDSFSDLDAKNLLIHISSYIHNTVLVQTLKRELSQKFPLAKIVLLKHDDKTKTCLKIFTLNKETDIEHISDDVLSELYYLNGNKDISIKEYRNKLFSRYFTDHLTNLPNVYQLRKDLQEVEDNSLIILNIDNFQTINNFYGFMVGDYVIEEVGKYLKEYLENRDVYRLSADEFAFILDNSLGFYELKDYLNKIYYDLQDILIEYQDIKIYIDLTIASTSDMDNNNIFSKVSMALKYAKQMSLPFWIYEDRMNFEDEYDRNIKLSSIVRKAALNSNILPYYQAIIDVKTKKVVKYECLARLIDDNQKILSPVLFIPIAKKIKIYNVITQTIIEKSFARFEDIDMEFSINLSIEDIMSSSIFNFIMEKLKTSKASKRVTFEILESDAIEDFKKVDRFISEVKRYGAKIAIDDFGSGYSNFAYLTKMSADYIKIDGSLIKDMDIDKNAHIVVETIVSFAKKLGIKTIAEYVHSSIIMDKVKGLDIDYAQGFYIDEPSLHFLE